eukprot:Nitzschia sp. Nitz4//scaffold65_size103378//81012//81763//NITZ4_004479-RA/size103378-processed-gene-0.57-mRNA-1//-1//CDS//3329556279//7204//frame0
MIVADYAAAEFDWCPSFLQSEVTNVLVSLDGSDKTDTSSFTEELLDAVVVVVVLGILEASVDGNGELDETMSAQVLKYARTIMCGGQVAPRRTTSFLSGVVLDHANMVIDGGMFKASEDEKEKHYIVLWTLHVLTSPGETPGSEEDNKKTKQQQQQQ